MPISDEDENDLFLAILSMDAYNRGYNHGIEGLGELGSGIGNATIITDSETTPATSDTGDLLNFYAAAYNYNGETIISYRGTDNPAILDIGTGDFWTGWLFGTGVTAGTQLELARDIYEVSDWWCGTVNGFLARVARSNHIFGLGTL